MNGIKGTSKELYAKKDKISTLSIAGKRTDIDYKDIKRIEYLFAQEKQNGYIVFSTVKNQSEKVEFKRNENNKVLKLINALKDKFTDIDFEEHQERMYQSGLNILLLISFIIGALYLLFSLFYWSGISSAEQSFMEQVGAGIATALVMPHLICTALAVLFNGLGTFMKKRGFALTGAILYSVAIVLFPMYFTYVIVEAVLSYIGFAKMPK